MGVAQGPESPNLCSGQSTGAEINCYNCLIATFLSFVLVGARRQLLERIFTVLRISLLYC